MGCGCKKQINNQKPIKQIVKRTPSTTKTPVIRRTIIKRQAK